MSLGDVEVDIDHPARDECGAVMPQEPVAPLLAQRTAVGSVIEQPGHSIDDREPKFYALPQPPLPSKDVGRVPAQVYERETDA